MRRGISMVVGLTLTVAVSAPMAAKGQGRSPLQGLEEVVSDLQTDVGALESDVLELQTDVGALESDVLELQASQSLASINGIVLHNAREDLGTTLNYLGDGSVSADDAGDTFASGTIQLPHGAEIVGMKCVVRDNDVPGYISVLLLRGPINVTDLPASDQRIASVFTNPDFSAPGFQELSDSADPARSVVDNGNYGYFFRVDFIDLSEESAQTFLNELTFRGCSVELQ